MLGQRLFGEEHKDIAFLKQDHISPVLARALYETYAVQPNDPIQFFARYLQNHLYTESEEVNRINQQVESKKRNDAFDLE